MTARRAVDRPFLWLLLASVALAGGVAGWSWLAGSRPPTPGPVILVMARDPNSDPKALAETVGAPIEQQIDGVEGLRSMTPSCVEDTYQLILIFDSSMTPDLARTLVQNRVALAEPILPEAVRRNGVTVTTKSPSRK